MQTNHLHAMCPSCGENVPTGQHTIDCVVSTTKSARREQCSTCAGTGMFPWDPDPGEASDTCLSCKGTGTIKY